MTSSPRELVTQNAKLQREQEQLIRNLLEILDDLDRACEHWQKAGQDQAQMIVQPAELRAAPESKTLFQRLLYWLRFWLRKLIGIRPTAGARRNSAIDTKSSIAPSAIEVIEIVESAHEGVEMIRRSLLDILRKQQVVPVEVLGQPFDPAKMYALGRQESTEVAENTVVQEVVRGYLWQNRILRESQVMVAVKPAIPE